MDGDKMFVLIIGMIITFLMVIFIIAYQEDVTQSEFETCMELCSRGFGTNVNLLLECKTQCIQKINTSEFCT